MEQGNNEPSLRDAVRDAMQDAMRDQHQMMQQMLQTMQAMMTRMEVQDRAQPIRLEERGEIDGGRERGFENLEAPPVRREQQRHDVGLPRYVDQPPYFENLNRWETGFRVEIPEFKGHKEECHPPHVDDKYHGQTNISDLKGEPVEQPNVSDSSLEFKEQPRAKAVETHLKRPSSESNFSTNIITEDLPEKIGSGGLNHIARDRYANGNTGLDPVSAFNTYQREEGSADGLQDHGHLVGENDPTSTRKAGISDPCSTSSGVNHPNSGVSSLPSSVLKDDPSSLMIGLAASFPSPNGAKDTSRTHPQRQMAPPLSKQFYSHNGIEGELQAQMRNGRPRVDSRTRSQLLPRYWPRITDQELQQISGDSNSVITPLFEKMLSASDAGRIGRLVLPKKCAEAYFPAISQHEGFEKESIAAVKTNEDEVNEIEAPHDFKTVREASEQKCFSNKSKDCLDTSGDASELESYLLATCDFYGDFLLLDPCDVGAVYDFLKTNAVGKENIAPHRGNSVRSKTRHSILTSPTGRSGASDHRSSVGKNQGININENMENNCAFEFNNDNHWSGPHVDPDHPDDDMCHVEEPNLGFSNDMDDSDDDIDDPWKPLNPHEPGNLKVKPFRKVKGFGRQVIHNAKKNTSTSQFPIAKLDGIVSQEFAESFEVKHHLQERLHASQSLPLFEKLRRSLTFGEQEAYDNFGAFEDEYDDNGGENHSPDFDQVNLDLPNSMHDMDTEVPSCHRKQSDDAATCDHVEGLTQNDLDSYATLEDLCRSHLDALLASIAETEKQTELATRVSTWKQRIEHTLEEQDAHPPFDIHLYGERILDKLFLEVDSGGTMPFTDVVMGQPKHDVARTFSALLQLVNNGNVDLQRAPASNEVVCHTAANPFYVRLLHDDLAQFMLGMGYATEALHLPGISKRLEFDLAMQSNNLKRALQCLLTMSNSRDIGQEASGMDLNNALRACPICRKVSYFVIPSVIWYSTKEENTWLQLLHNIRHKWIPAYLKGFFFAELSATRKLESMNRFYRDNLDRKTSLLAFIAKFDQVMDDRYEKEAQEDLSVLQDQQILKTNASLEKQAANEYTRAVFEEFQVELIKTLEHYSVKVQDRAISKFSVERDGNVHDRQIVHLSASEKKACCSCYKFDFAGENSSLRSSFSEEGVSDEDISLNQSLDIPVPAIQSPVPATQSTPVTSGKPTPGSPRRSKRLQAKRA